MADIFDLALNEHAIHTAELMYKKGVCFVPVPLLPGDDHKAMLQDMVERLEKLSLIRLEAGGTKQ